MIRFKFKKNIIYFSLLFLVAITCLYHYQSLSNYLDSILHSGIENYHYYAFAGSILFIEFFPQPFLSSWVPFVIGVLFGLNYFNLMVISIVFSIISNYLAFWVGFKFGESVVPFFIGEKNYLKSKKWFDRYGNKSIMFLALTPLPYFPVLGGLFKMTTREFTVYAILPRVVHFIIFLPLMALFF